MFKVKTGACQIDGVVVGFNVEGLLEIHLERCRRAEREGEKVVQTTDNEEEAHNGYQSITVYEG